MRTLFTYVAACAFLLCGLSAAAAQAVADAPPAPGTITGSVTDETDTAIAGARVTWSRTGAPSPSVATAKDGGFSIARVAAGPYVLTVSSPGFASQTVSGTLDPGEHVQLPPIRLRIAFGAVSVSVTPTVVEVAERQIKEQEQQRLLGVLPNYFVVYDKNAAPLTPGQKFELFRASMFDPADFAFTGIVAGIQHARNDYAGFGRGTQGYAKRYAALYATIFTRGAIDGVLLPILFRQDPRYFFKGEGTVPSRIGYAVSTAFIRKGDNRRWQPNYSTILGGLAAGALTNFYYPAQDRRGMRLTLENSAIALATTAASHLAQEFLFPKLTTHGSKPGPPPEPGTAADDPPPATGR